MFTPAKPGDRRLQMPGISLLVQDMIDALQRVAGEKVTELIQYKPDPFICSIVANWPKSFEAKRALELGFVPDKSFDDILKNYMKDEGIQGKFVTSPGNE